MEVEALLSALKPLADSGTLGASDAAQAASRDSRLLMHAAAEADSRSRAALGTGDFQSWSDVAVACARAMAPDRE
jgi:hypothetical protein